MLLTGFGLLDIINVEFRQVNSFNKIDRRNEQILIKVIRDFFRFHFFNKRDNSVILIWYASLTLFQLIAAFSPRLLSSFYFIIPKMNSNILTVFQCAFPFLFSGILFLFRQIIKHIKRKYEDKPVYRKSISGYVGIVKNADLRKQYTLSELSSSRNLANKENIPVYLSENTIDPSSSTEEKHSLVHHLQQQGLLIERTGHLKTMQKLILDRFQDFTSPLKAIFLVGPSGAGKTIFMHMLEEKLENCTCVYYSFSHYWSKTEFIKKLDAFSQTPNEKFVMLIDQFEMCFSSSLFEPSFLEKYLLNKFPNTVFVFACPINELGNAFMFLHTNESKTIIHYLSIDNEDSEKLPDLKYRVDNDILRNILEETRKQVKANIYPIAALQIIGNLMEEEAVSALDSQFVAMESEIRNSPEKIVNLYFEQWLSLFEYPQFGISVLYLLSDGKPHTSTDIQNITLLGSGNSSFPSDALIKIICSNKFIELNNGNQFHIIHDYLSNLTLQFCKNSPYLTENMRTGIDYYRDEIENCKTAKSEIGKRNFRYLGRNKKTGSSFSSTLLGCLLAFTLVGPSIIAFINGSHCDFSLNCQFVAISFCCCFSTYYIYNICKYFFRIYRFLYVITAIPGIVSMLFCFLFPDYWAVVIGAELVWLGICMGRVAFTLKKKARLVFQKNFASFVSIGISVILLGFAYVFLRRNLPGGLVPFVDLVFYGVFLVFILISITAHINVSFMYERLDLTLMTKSK